MRLGLHRDMRTVVAALAFTVLAVEAAPAFAQSPGECACAVPAPAAVVIVEAPRRKLGVSLRMSALGMHPSDDPEAHTDFSGGGLAVSYRINRRWGIELAADHFTEDTEEGTPRELQAVSVSATFHLRPYRYARWDGYLIAGLGTATAVTEGNQAPVGYGSAHLGLGLERRFRRLGISAELRMIGMGEAKDEEAQPAAASRMEPRSDEERGISGGQVSLAATYYF